MEKKNILILNGPNLNLLGTREPAIYGAVSFEAFLEGLRVRHPGVTIDYYQSNHEGALIDKIHAAGFSLDGIVLNAGAYTHTSVALADAVAAVAAPVIEVHVSNTARRETFRHRSFLTAVCRGVISGFGLASYELAVIALENGEGAAWSR
ncbi:MAG: type II 3-dehydroquinate dehydratase [Odoribacteraceae bacterium]|jgi:3-dehydroquinate dehydratase-2|nr:type II 3-dehydroquinate dehydratase [Odoribacteraceae bacterium]